MTDHETVDGTEHDPDLLRFDEDRAGNVVRVTGGVFTDLDARRLEHRLTEAATHAPGVVTVDLDAVTFLPSRAIRALVMAQRAATAHGSTVRLVAGEDALAHRMLRAVGFTVEDPAVDPTRSPAVGPASDDDPPWTAS
ncbi:MAG TPA: STAS domain-containing protein [Nocardioides sp.]